MNRRTFQSALCVRHGVGQQRAHDLTDGPWGATRVAGAGVGGCGLEQRWAGARQKLDLVDHQVGS